MEFRAGLQFSNYACLDVGEAELFNTLRRIAVTAEQSGFDSVFVVDHFYGLPPYGGLDGPMLEAYTLLGALAACTDRVALGTLVSGVTYRAPALLAKTVTTLDVISGGRAILGIGAGWFEAEHHGLGIPFPALNERFELLEETLVITDAMFRGNPLTFEGKHTQVHEIVNHPGPVRGYVPVLIGGQGRRKTMPLMARFADVANVTCDLDQVPDNVAALHRICLEQGRDPRSLPITWHGCVFSGKTRADAEYRRDRYLASRGLPPWHSLSGTRQVRIGARWICGSVDEVAARVAQLVDAGISGITCNVLAPGHDLDAYATVGAALSEGTSG